jgi:hypothetical protein
MTARSAARRGTSVLLVLLTVAAAAPLCAQGSVSQKLAGEPVFTPRRAAGRIEPGIALDGRTQEAIQKGLLYLREHRNPSGAWTDIVGRKVHNTYEGELNEHVGVTALAGIAFLASGSLPDQGPYCDEIRGALQYVMGQVQENGFITAHGSRMYEHAFATLFLAEAYGTTRDERVKENLKMAVRLIEKAQNSGGGWRYLPGAQDSDMSVTVCQVMALRAARNAGIQVGPRTINEAVRYVKESFRPEEGAFDYQFSQQPFRSRTSFALTAAGVTTLYGAGEYDAVELKKGLEFLWRNRPEPEHAENRFDYYYAQYYAVQAMFQAGGSLWSGWYKYVRDDLLSLQKTDGSWQDLVGANYATAMAAIILQIPYQYLPITER